MSSKSQKVKVPQTLLSQYAGDPEIQQFFQSLEDRDLLGEIYSESTNRNLADSVSVTNGTITSGTVVDTQTINQTYLTVQETGQYTIDYTFVGLSGDPARIEFVGRYEGNIGHVVLAYFWNYVTSAWDRATAAATDFPSSTTDYALTFSHPLDSSMYVSGGESKFRISHTSPANNLHYFYTDYIALLEKTSVLTNAGTFYKVTGLTTGNQHRTIVDGSAGTITAQTPGWYTVNMSVAFYGSPDTRFYGHIFVNDVLQENAGLSRYIGSGGDVGSATMHAILWLNKDDVVDVRAASTSSGVYFGLDHFNLSLRGNN